MSVLLHVAADPEQEGRYQICRRCRLILQDFTQGEVGVLGVAPTPTGTKVLDLPPLMLPTWRGLVAVDEQTMAMTSVDEADAGQYEECRPRCVFRHGEEPCHKPSTYRVEIADCPFCHRHGALLCLGHDACVECGGGLRAETFQSGFDDGDDVDVVVERISAVYGRAA